MPRVYIAAPAPLIDHARALRNVLVAAGDQVTARWLDVPFEDTPAAARMDLDDIDAADLLIALNPEPWRQKGTGGRHVELGYALARGKQVLLVGARTNVFHYDARVTFLPMSPATLTWWCYQRAAVAPSPATVAGMVAALEPCS